MIPDVQVVDCLQELGALEHALVARILLVTREAQQRVSYESTFHVSAEGGQLIDAHVQKIVECAERRAADSRAERLRAEAATARSLAEAAETRQQLEAALAQLAAARAAKKAVKAEILAAQRNQAAFQAGTQGHLQLPAQGKAGLQQEQQEPQSLRDKLRLAKARVARGHR